MSDYPGQVLMAKSRTDWPMMVMLMLVMISVGAMLYRTEIMIQQCARAEQSDKLTREECAGLYQFVSQSVSNIHDRIEDTETSLSVLSALSSNEVRSVLQQSFNADKLLADRVNKLDVAVRLAHRGVRSAMGDRKWGEFVEELQEESDMAEAKQEQPVDKSE